MIEEIEKRFKELLRRPKTKEEIEEMEIIRKQFTAELNRETIDLLNDLKKVDIDISSVWDLVNSKESYPAAIDILLSYLPKQFHPRNKEGIVRALAVKEAKGKAAKMLIEEYNKTPKEFASLRWALGYSIAIVMTMEDVNEIFEIVSNLNNGRSRAELVRALGTIKTEKSENILLSLLDDNEVLVEAILGLNKMKSIKAKDKIKSFKNHSNEMVRKEVNRYLKKV